MLIKSEQTNNKFYKSPSFELSRLGLFVFARQQNAMKLISNTNIKKKKEILIKAVSIDGVSQNDVELGIMECDFPDYGLLAGDVAIIVKNQPLQKGDVFVTSDNQISRYEHNLSVVGKDKIFIGAYGKITHIIRRLV